MLINLIDARRGLHEKCVELFADKNIAEQIYRNLCEGIDDCEIVAEKTGKWIDSIEHDGWFCSKCGYSITSRYGKYNYCPNCGSRMGE